MYWLRADKATTAQANRAMFGLTKAERQALRISMERRHRIYEDHFCDASVDRPTS
ncbi:MAG: DUF4169 family protein [Sphingobium sp.]